MTELKLRLQSHGFESAKLCTDRNDECPDGYDEQERREFWWQVSRDFLEHADVAVFLFLDDVPRRSELPELAFGERGQSDRDRLPQDINISVDSELDYWLDEIDRERERTLVLFEESCYEEMGGLTSAKVSTEGVDWGVVPSEDVEEATLESVGRCQNWAMNQCKPRLQDRYFADRS
ncbi:hypothetical protein [Halorussus caseinilyticus]|uniref:hypothetical protein n=1 Tax=Halorussus caseinilyticus TaxID=3034025 RepID=UPI0023E8A756|nr:hypothetical protein [Halorussus sp. DT72]